MISSELSEIPAFQKYCHMPIAQIGVRKAHFCKERQQIETTLKQKCEQNVTTIFLHSGPTSFRAEKYLEFDAYMRP